MDIYKKYSLFFDKPLSIANQDTKEIIDNFFFNCPLHLIRSTLHSMVEASLISDFPLYSTPDERKHLLWFQKELIEVLEAVFESRKNNG